MKTKEIKYYGLHACLAIWEHRPEDIIRVYLHESNVDAFRQVLKWCASKKLAYHIVPTDDLDRISDSVHHEGVCLLAREGLSLSLKDLKLGSSLLYLDGVQNPHNLGGVLRTAAHFGLSAILGEKGKLPMLSPSCCRIAKGGAELVPLIALPDPLEALRKLKAQGYTLIGTSSHAKVSLYRSVLPARSIFLIGAESTGLGTSFQRETNLTLMIPGTGKVESLNVSVATALCLGEYARQHA
jgi:TrmH RNA methyltransferase